MMSLMMSDYLTDGGDVSEPEQPSEVYGDAVRAEEVRTHYRSVHHHLMIEIFRGWFSPRRLLAGFLDSRPSGKNLLFTCTNRKKVPISFSLFLSAQNRGCGLTIRGGANV